MDTWRLVAIIGRRLWLILLVAGIAAGGAYLASGTLPREYQSESKVLVGSLTETRPDYLSAYQELAQTYAALATSTPVLGRVIDELGLPDTPEALATRLAVYAPVGQPIITVTATASSPAGAAALANAVAGEITSFARPAGADTTSLASVVQTALPNLEPTSPRVALNTVVAAALGLALGLAAALLMPVRDRRIAASKASATADVASSQSRISR